MIVLTDLMVLKHLKELLKFTTNCKQVCKISTRNYVCISRDNHNPCDNTYLTKEITHVPLIHCYTCSAQNNNLFYVGI